MINNPKDLEKLIYEFNQIPEQVLINAIKEVLTEDDNIVEKRL